MKGFGMRMTEEEVAAHQKRINAQATGQVVHSSETGKDVVDLKTPPKPSKYGNRKTEIDGELFDSEKEAQHWQKRRLEQLAGAISDLRRQVVYRFRVNNMEVCTYRADVVYKRDGVTVVEDVKGYKKGEAYRLFLLKKALMKALYKIDVQEI